MRRDAIERKRLDAATIAELNRQGVEHWQRVGPLLEARRIAEARAMTDVDRRRAIRAVLGLSRKRRPPQTTSGLVEFYRKLGKLQRK